MTYDGNIITRTDIADAVFIADTVQRFVIQHAPAVILIAFGLIALGRVWHWAVA